MKHVKPQEVVPIFMSPDLAAKILRRAGQLCYDGFQPGQPPKVELESRRKLTLGRAIRTATEEELSLLAPEVVALHSQVLGHLVFNAFDAVMDTKGEELAMEMSKEYRCGEWIYDSKRTKQEAANFCERLAALLVGSELMVVKSSNKPN